MSAVGVPAFMRRPWGEDIFTSFLGQGLSRDRAVLVDEPTEHVVALDLGSGGRLGAAAPAGTPRSRPR
jgi:hypothetical protein